MILLIMINDPMDDFGHGTHVAGIAAANGTSLKGVAPDASLYAFKVLDNTGRGLNSVVIAGIERALDPDQDTNTNDAVNIISMSLGGPGDPDDPVCRKQLIMQRLPELLVLLLLETADPHIRQLVPPVTQELR